MNNSVVTLESILDKLERNSLNFLMQDLYTVKGALKGIFAANTCMIENTLARKLRNALSDWDSVKIDRYLVYLGLHRKQAALTETKTSITKVTIEQLKDFFYDLTGLTVYVFDKSGHPDVYMSITGELSDAKIAQVEREINDITSLNTQNLHGTIHHNRFELLCNYFVKDGFPIGDYLVHYDNNVMPSRY